MLGNDSVAWFRKIERVSFRPLTPPKRRVRSVETSVPSNRNLGRLRPSTGLSNSSNRSRSVVGVADLFFPQRTALGFDARESTPGFKRQLVVLNAETRSLKRVKVVAARVLGQRVSTNTIERICLDVGEDLAIAEQQQWEGVIDGEVPVPSLAIVEFDGGRIRTRKTGCGPGVHLDAKGWNETKNAIFVSAASTPSDVDPQSEPPRCFLDPDHVAKLAESAKTTENVAPIVDSVDEAMAAENADPLFERDAHKPKRLLRTFLSSMNTSQDFGPQMRREAKRRRFDEAPRKAFVGDGLPCNWTIRKTYFRDDVAILDFVHAVSHLFAASVACFGKTEEAWNAYTVWMCRVWQSDVVSVIDDLKSHQRRIGEPPAGVSDDDPRERLRLEIGYRQNNGDRMNYVSYRCQGLPTTSAWMESAVKELNYRVKGTEMFWNNPSGAEAILRIRAAALSDDDRLVRLLTNRPGQATVRRTSEKSQAP